MSKEQKVIFEPHPVSPERKAELRAEGYKIIDARFAPADHKQDAEAEQSSEGAAKPMTIAQIKGALAEKGVEIPEGVTKRDDLKALLESVV